MKTITIEVTATVPKLDEEGQPILDSKGKPETELVGTSRDVEVAQNLTEAIEVEEERNPGSGENAVYQKYLDAIRAVENNTLRADLVASVDPSKAKRKSQARMVTLK